MALLLAAGRALAADERLASPEAQRTPMERPSVVAVVPAFGVIAFGRGTQRVECEGACEQFAGLETGYAHLPALFLGADVLFGVGRFVRVGPGFRHTFSGAVELGGSSSFVVGNDWNANAVVEGFVPFARRWGVAPRVEGGVLVLAPGGDLRDYLRSIELEFCPLVAGDCPLSGGARAGWNAAVGASGWFRPHERLRARLDVRLQYYALELYTLDSTVTGQPIEVTESLSGARLSIGASVEAF